MCGPQEVASAPCTQVYSKADLYPRRYLGSPIRDITVVCSIACRSEKSAHLQLRQQLGALLLCSRSCCNIRSSLLFHNFEGLTLRPKLRLQVSQLQRRQGSMSKHTA